MKLDHHEQIEVPIDRLDWRYGELRLPRLRQERALEASMRRHGQLTPIVACEREGSLALVDGFKRTSAARRLELGTVRACVVPLSEQAALSAMHSLNRHSSGLVDLEEAFIVRELVRKQGLAQMDVAALLGRHKSWVSRRLMLVERLHEDVQADVRVGLVSVTAAREIAQLPRGNQREVASTVYRSGLTTREAGALVNLFDRTRDRKEQEALLAEPRQAIERFRGGRKSAPYDPRLEPAANRVRQRSKAVVGTAGRLTQELQLADVADWSEVERSVLQPLLRQARRALDLLTTALDEALTELGSTNGP